MSTKVPMQPIKLIFRQKNCPEIIGKCKDHPKSEQIENYFPINSLFNFQELQTEYIGLTSKLLLLKNY